MKSRPGTTIAPVLVVVLALGVALGAGISPASAAPAAPTVSDLDASTPGHVTGTVASDQPFVLVRLFSDDLTEMYATWDGTGDDPYPVIGGTYTIGVIDISGNVAAPTTTVAVSDLRLIRTTYRRTVTASGSKVAQYVGRCSALRTPARRGWSGSLGYHANDRCGRHSWRASAVSTAHRIRLPAAERYLNIHVNTYGGAARSRPRSRAIVRYRTTSDTWVGVHAITGSLGTRAGPTLSTNGLVSRNRSFRWGVASAYGNRYDVARFTVVLHYYVVG